MWTPFLKQCWASSGVFMSVAQITLVLCFATTLLPQLQRPGAAPSANEDTCSWIASILDFPSIPSHLLISVVMGKFGRKVAHLVITSAFLGGWLILAFADSVEALLIGRAVQGSAISMCIAVSPILIGEYSSPKYRGMLITAMLMLSSIIGIVTLTSGLYLHWNTLAIACTCYAFVNLILVMYSPETPSWLIEKGRYEEGRHVFLSLRESCEDEELTNLVESSKKKRADRDARPNSDQGRKKIVANIRHIQAIIRKREFYRPVIIMVHLLALFHWSGFPAVTVYLVDTVKTVMGGDEYLSPVIMSIGGINFVSNIVSIYITKIFRRKVLLIGTLSLHIVALLSIAGYIQARATNFLSVDHPAIGITLLYFHSFTMTIGPGHLFYLYAGEIFPVEYRSLANSLSSMLNSPNVILSVKSMPYLKRTIGFPALFCLYAAIVSYCSAVCYSLVPETRDKTLHDIEGEIRGNNNDIVLENLKTGTPDGDKLLTHK